MRGTADILRISKSINLLVKMKNIFFILWKKKHGDYLAKPIIMEIIMKAHHFIEQKCTIHCNKLSHICSGYRLKSLARISKNVCKFTDCSLHSEEWILPEDRSDFDLYYWQGRYRCLECLLIGLSLFTWGLWAM